MHQAEPAFFLNPQKKYCDFGRSTVSNRVEPQSAMNNSKLFVSAICVLGLTLAAPLNTEAGRGGGGRGGGGGHSASAPRGGSFARGGYAPGGYARGGYARGGYTRGGYTRAFDLLAILRRERQVNMRRLLLGLVQAR